MEGIINLSYHKVYIFMIIVKFYVNLATIYIAKLLALFWFEFRYCGQKLKVQ